MKHILCFGDSNTFGYDAKTDGRFPWGVRWTSVVQEKLGGEYRIIEEGMGGRTTVWNDPIEDCLSGKDYLLPCLKSHQPLDLVIIMLGTNDLKARFGLPTADIAAGVENLVHMIQDFFGKKEESPAILIISPIEVAEEIVNLPLGEMLGNESAVRRSREFPAYYKQMAEQNGCEFMAASDYAKPCAQDGLHIGPEGHKQLGQAVAEKILAMGI